ncbi:MAG: hypothetical protein IT578_12285 [Verrucomicrobiae bacterium]|nr:hypothetical protein [Verrucomicrobiae bacterium]
MKRNLYLLGLMMTTFALHGQGIAPRFVVPECPKPPVIDGEIGATEWQHAAAITGFKDHSTGQLDARQVVAYITYDNAHLYLAFDLPIYPKGAALVANHTTRDRGHWGGDDILELLLDPFAGKYKNEESYFQFMGNSAGSIIFDQAETPSLGLYNRLEWNGRWNFKNKVTSDRWQSELSIPLADLGLKEIPDGARWLAHFSRVWGVKVGWTTLSPVSGALNAPGGGGELTFEAKAPAVQVRSVAPLLNGRFGFAGEIVNGNAERDFKIEARVTSQDKEITAKTLEVHLKPGEVHPFSVDEAAALADHDVFHLRISSPKENKIWHDSAVPFLKTPVHPVFPKPVLTKFVLEARCLPSLQKLWFDKIDFGRFPGRDKVKEVRVSLRKDDKVLLDQPLAFPGTQVQDLGLPIPEGIKTEGDYKVAVTLLDKDHQPLATEEMTFPWKSFPWVNSRVGMEGGILPPFTPLTVRDREVSVVGRVYSVNDLGLFNQVTAEQLEPTVGKATDALLARPLSLRARVAGTRQPIEAKPTGKRKVLEEDPQHAVIEGHGKLGDLALKITNRIEYDGVAWLDIELRPTKATRLAELTFDIPLREEQATLLHEVTDAIRRTYAGVTPAGAGTVWDSRRLLNVSGTIGNFKPLYWLGNEDRGLCWFGESDKGWHLDEEKPALEVVREKGAVILRLNLVNKELLLDQPRTIAFGLQATPVKPMPAGWRGWVAPYAAAEFKNLTYFNFSPVGNQTPTYAAVENAPFPADYAKAKEAMDQLRAAGGIPFLYEVLQSMGIAIPDMRVYSGEWQRASYIGANSYADFRVWHLAEYLKRTGLFTFYEDNAYLLPLKDPALGLGYKREDGQYQGEFPIRKLREYLRREAAAYHALQMPNYIGVHKSTTMLSPCYSFATLAIDGEQRFMMTPETDYVDQFPLDYIRAHIMGRQFGFVPFFLSEIKLGKDLTAAIRAGTRSEFALLLLHELIIWPAYALDPETVKQVDRAKGEFDLGAADVVFHPYWEKNKIARTDSKDVVVTLWKRPGKALAVVANLGEARETSVSLDFKALGLAPKTIKDFESQQALSWQGDALKLTIPRHDYRLLWIE